MTREDPQMKLRLPVELKYRLMALAEENGRSLNAEVVKRLEESLTGASEGAKTAPADDRTMDLFADSVAERVVRALDQREARRPKS